MLLDRTEKALYTGSQLQLSTTPPLPPPPHTHTHRHAQMEVRNGSRAGVGY